jgi:hypothetical protein
MYDTHNTIKCKHCGKEIEISEAIKHQIEEQALAEERVKHQKELSDTTRQAEERALSKLKDEFDKEMNNIRLERDEEKQRNNKLLKELTDLNDELRKLRRKDEERELEMKKKLADEEEKIREETKKRAMEEHELKDKEKDKKLTDALKQIEILKTQIQQGSQQTQGEVLELEIENILKTAFPEDEITEVKKGQRGADVIQVVVDKKGRACGKILWEIKNAKWSDSWISKLRDDKRASKCELAVLVSVNLPSEVETFKYRDGVWITGKKFIEGLALALRFDLIHIYNERQMNDGKNEKMEHMYQYLTGMEFKHRIEAIAEAFTNMQADIEREKRWFSSKWSRQEKEIRKIVDNTHGMYGELQAVTGRSLQNIKSLMLAEEIDR